MGPYAIVRIQDTFDADFFHYAMRGRLLLEHGLYNWYPYYAGGMPAFAWQSPPDHLLTLISAFIPMWLVYGLLRITLMTLAGYGMYQLLLRLFQVKRALAVFGGAAFAFFVTFAVENFVFNYAFPIFFIWWLDLQDPDIRFFSKILRVLGLLGISLLSYPVLTLPYFPLLHLALVVCFYHNLGPRKPLIINTILIWVGYVLLYVPTLYALLKYIPLAHRNYPFSFPGLSAGLRTLADCFYSILVFPPTLLLLIMGLPLLWRVWRLKTIYAFVLAIMACHAFFSSSMKYIFKDHFISRLDLYHISVLLPICGILAVTLVLEEMLVQRQTRYQLLLVGLGLIVSLWLPNPIIKIFTCLMGLGAYAITKWRADASKEGALAAVMMAGACVIFVVSLSALGMAAKQQDILNYHPYARNHGNYSFLSRLAEESRKEVFRVGTIDIPPTVAQSYGLETVAQRGGLFNRYYKQLIKTVIKPQLDSSEKERYFDNYWYTLYLTTFDPTNRSQTYHSDQPRSINQWHIPLLIMMNTKYLISKNPIEGIEACGDLVQKIEGDEFPLKFLRNTRIGQAFRKPLWIYHLRQAFPRGFLARDPVVLPDHQQVMDRLAQQSVGGLQKNIFFAAGDLPPAGFQGSETPASPESSQNLRLTEFSPDRLVFEGTISSPEFLVVTNNYDPGWQALINGVKTPIYRANLAFQAVYLKQAGSFRAVLEYRDSALWWLQVATIMGMLLFLVPALRGGEIYRQDGRCALEAQPAQAGGICQLAKARTMEPNLAPWWLICLSDLIVVISLTMYFLYSQHFTMAEYKVYIMSAIPVSGVLLGIWAATLLKRGKLWELP
jgi:hypothetical protein